MQSHEINLTYNTELEHLTVSDIDFLDISLSSPHSVPTIIPTVSSPCIKEMYFTCSVFSVGDLELFKWPDISRSLEGYQFAGLRQLHFKVLHHSIGPHAALRCKRFVEKKLATLSARGILHVVAGWYVE